MRQVNGQFIGKSKVSLDSKYINKNTNQLDKDIEETTKKVNSFKHELETAIDMCYERNVNQFRMYETAAETVQEVLRNKFVEYAKKVGEEYTVK